MSIWDFIVWIFWFYIWFSVIIIFFTVFFDVFRDKSLNGWAKALWAIFLIALPLLGVVVYFIARGGGMTERKYADSMAAQEAQASYIQSVAGKSSVEDIATAKGLLDSGAITQAEYDAIKAKAIA
jgi:hypothetical protein